MTKFSLLASEIESTEEKSDALNSKIFNTLASMSILAQLKSDAMKNSLSKDEVNLPMDFFRFIFNLVMIFAPVNSRSTKSW
jgi:hypothetical protein